MPAVSCVWIKTRILFFWSCLDLTLDGWELIEVTAPSYLPRPTCFHLIYIYGVVGPAAVVVKLDVPGHSLHLDLPWGTDRHRGMCNSHHFAYIAGIKVLVSVEQLECAQPVNQMMNWIRFNKRCSFMVMRAWIWVSSVQRYLEAEGGEQLCALFPSLCHFPSLSQTRSLSLPHFF